MWFNASKSQKIVRCEACKCLNVEPKHPTPDGVKEYFWRKRAELSFPKPVTSAKGKLITSHNKNGLFALKCAGKVTQSNCIKTIDF